MVRLHKLFAIISIVGATLLTGCASVKTASVSEDAKAKTFTTNPNQAKLYIYRNEFMGQAIRMTVELNGKEIGKTGSKTYFAVDVPPGKHTIVSRAENDTSLDLITEAGKNYFVWQEVKMGILSARSKLQLVDQEQGQAGVRESKLLEINSEAPKSTSPTIATNRNNSAAIAETKQASSTSSAPQSNSSADEANLNIQKVPFEIGVSSATVERIAKQNSCETDLGAGLLYKKGPVEVYRVNCKDGREIKARCELRQCSLFTP